MSEPKEAPAKEIYQQVKKYCHKHLDNEYRDTCNNVVEHLLLEDPAIFNRGKTEIWSAAIVWAVGSINFLGDKSFAPYASLSDVCSYFNANTSTVGQKATKIRELLNMHYFNPEFQTSNSLSDLLNSLVMTPDGFIVPADMSEDREPENNKSETPEYDESAEYMMVLRSSIRLDSASLYQLEYLIKKMLSKESRFISIEKKTTKTVRVIFYGTISEIERMDDNLVMAGYSIVDVFYIVPDDEE
jgi:hypothetical protein